MTWTITQTQHLQSVNNDPLVGVVDDYLVAFYYDGYSGWFSVLHVPTMTTHVWDDILASGPECQAVFAYDGKAYWSYYTSGAWYMYRSDVVTGLTSLVGTCGGLFARYGNEIICNKHLDLATGTISNIYGSYANWPPGVTSTGRLYRVSGTTCVELNRTTGALIDTITLLAPTSWVYGSGLQVGSKLLWWNDSTPARLVGVDTATNTPVVVVGTPTPLPSGGQAWQCQPILGSDGYIYRSFDSSITAVDPVTGEHDSGSISGALLSNVVEYDGKLWCGDKGPNPWP